MEDRAMTREEILSREHPAMINVEDISSGHIYDRGCGQTRVYIVETVRKRATPEERQKQRERIDALSWEIIRNMRAHGVDV